MTEVVLPLLIIIPLVTAAVIALLPAGEAAVAEGTEVDSVGSSSLSKWVALVGSSAAGLLSLYVLASFSVGEKDFQFVSETPWIDSLGLGWTFGVDGISLFMVVLTGVLFPIAIVTSSAHHDVKPYHIWLMLLMSGSMGAFVAIDLLLFFLFFEVVLVPMYFLIGGWGHGNRIYASMKFFLYTMAASALMLVGIVSLVLLAAGKDGPTFDYRELVVLMQGNPLSQTAAMLVFLTFALAFSVKVPLVPIHTWLPDAHTEAPTAGSIILAGVLLKLGTYGFIRFGVGLFPEQVKTMAPLFLTLGVIGIVYGAAVATMQKDLKRLVAYSSVAHMGFIVLGVFALNSQGLVGAVVQMINHGLSTGALFILVGWVYERRHTRQISELGGLQKSAPILAAVFTIVMLSSVGLPGLNGFVGEFLILLGTFQSGQWWAVVAVTGVILAALYLLWAYQRTFHGPATGANAEMKDLRPAELITILPLLGLIVFLGVYPRPMLDRIEPSVEKLLEIAEEPSSGNVPLPRSGVDCIIASAEEAEKKHHAESKHSEKAGSEDSGHGNSESQSESKSEHTESDHSSDDSDAEDNHTDCSSNASAQVEDELKKEGASK